MKIDQKDGLYYAKTTFKGIKINLIAWRTPWNWSVQANSIYGNVTVSNNNPKNCFKDALKTIRMNLPNWSQPNFEVY